VLQRNLVLFFPRQAEIDRNGGSQPTLTALFGFPKTSASDVATDPFKRLAPSPARTSDTSCISTVNQPQQKNGISFSLTPKFWLP